MAYQTPPVAVAGQPLLAADWNTKVRASIEDVAKPPMAKVSRITTQSIPNGALTAVSWTVEDLDTALMFDPATPDRLIVKANGDYLVQFGAQFAVNATGARFLGIYKNGATLLAAMNGAGSAAWYIGATVSALAISCVVGDYFTANVLQASGGALNIDPIYPIWLAAHQLAR